MSVDAVLALVPQAEYRYSRLVLVVGPSGSGKTVTLRGAAPALGCDVVNVGRNLAERLLAVHPRFRPGAAPTQLDAILPGDGPALLDNTEILFDPVLELEPLLLLQGLSRNRLVIAAWNGYVEGQHLRYAPVGHPAERRYRVTDQLIVSLSKRSA